MGTIKALVSLLIMISACLAVDINISGTVTNQSGTPIEGAAVQLEKLSLPTTTGSDGSFTITGTVGINTLKESHPKLSASVSNGKLFINPTEKSQVEITTYNLQGRELFNKSIIASPGPQGVTLPHLGRGLYIYRVKIGSRELMVKSPSIMSTGFAKSIQGTTTTIAKQEMSYEAINDVIVVNKDGYLNYRVMVTNSDTSGIEIEMIVCEDILTDIDGNEYQTVKIGNQIWTVENLRTTKYNDGTPVPHVTDTTEWVFLKTGGYCYLYNVESNKDKFGALYNWDAVNTRKIAPKGWHVPSDAEWDTLQNYLIDSGYNWDGSTSGNKIGKSLAAKTDWKTAGNIEGNVGVDLAANNSSGFSGLPSGYRNRQDGHYGGEGYNNVWWSTTESNELTAETRELRRLDQNLYKYANDKAEGYSVRLVKD